jgi:hypothetical protein
MDISCIHRARRTLGVKARAGFLNLPPSTTLKPNNRQHDTEHDARESVRIAPSPAQFRHIAKIHASCKASRVSSLKGHLFRFVNRGRCTKAQAAGLAPSLAPSMSDRAVTPRRDLERPAHFPATAAEALPHSSTLGPRLRTARGRKAFHRLPGKMASNTSIVSTPVCPNASCDPLSKGRTSLVRSLD